MDEQSQDGLAQLSEDDLQVVYNWVDEIPLSRPKRNIQRDFSDGVLLAEIVKHFLPKLIDLHNYSQAHSVAQKSYNWNTLNVKVLKKIGLTLTKKEIENVVNMAPDTIESVLLALKYHIEQKLANKGQSSMMQQDPYHQDPSMLHNYQHGNKEN